MDLQHIPKHVLEDVRERGNSDSQIEKMNPKEVFTEYCSWHGIINWGDALYDLAVGLFCLSQVENNEEKDIGIGNIGEYLLRKANIKMETTKSP